MGVRMATLEELVLEAINIENYYEKFVAEIEIFEDNRAIKKYKAGFNNKKKALCPLPDHMDRDPSFGFMRDKKNSKIQLYHCFGCGAVGNVIRLHQILINCGKLKFPDTTQAKISYLEATKDLAKRLGISERDAVERSINTNEVYYQKQLALQKCKESYTIRDFQNEMLKLRMGNYNSQNKKILANRALVRLLKNNKEELSSD